MSSISSEHESEVTGVDEQAVANAPVVPAVYVHEVPVRIWHWINALAIVVLCVTGYFIGSPLPTMPGEASQHYLMGYIRFAHFSAGYVFAIGLLGRLYWAFVGNHYSREMFTYPVLSTAYWREFGDILKWYLFISQRPHRYVGHNPLARAAMFFMFFWGSLFMIATGFALYGEGTQAGSWAALLFGWVIPLMGQSQDVHSWHHLGMWLIVCFVLVHVYAAIREDIMGRQSMVSTMISGWRTFKD